MYGFAKLTMRDSGLPIHISPRHVEQVRLDPESRATAIYLTGKNSPIVVLEKLDVVMRALQGLHESESVVVEADFRQAAPEPEIEAEPVTQEPEPIVVEPVVAIAKPKRAPKPVAKKKVKRLKPPKIAVPPAPAEAPGSWLLSHR